MLIVLPFWDFNHSHESPTVMRVHEPLKYTVQHSATKAKQLANKKGTLQLYTSDQSQMDFSGMVLVFVDDTI